MSANNSIEKLNLSLVGCAVITALYTAPILAQEQPAADGQQIERLMVTSRKKSESIIEVPMNVSTVGAIEIADRNLLNKEDLFRSLAGAASPRGELILRGLSGGNASSDINTTSTFTDGIPYDFSDLYDVERVEILRGPQGTLYGSNAIGGTVRIITKKPQLDEFEVNTSIQVNKEKNVQGLDQRLYATLNMPLSDELALRVTGSSSDQPLSITNVNTGVQGNIRANFLRAQLLWQPQEDFSINLGVIHDGFKQIGTDTADVATGGASYEAALTANPDAPFSYDVDISEAPACEGTRVECMSSGYIAGGSNPRYNAWELMDSDSSKDTNMFTLNINHDNLFGLASMSYDGSFRHYDDYVATDSSWSRTDGSDMFRTWLVNDYQRQRTTHELRFSNIDSGSPIDWTVGYFYDKDEMGKGGNNQYQYHGNGDQGKAIASAFWGDYWGYFGSQWEDDNGNLHDISNIAEVGLMYWNDPDINYGQQVLLSYATEKSLFGEVSYTLQTQDLGEFEFTAGIRFYDLQDREKIDIKGIWSARANADNRPDLDEDTFYVNHTDQGGNESGNRKKFSASWRPSQDMSVYALYAEGYRPGGNNVTSLPSACRNDENAKYFDTRYESDAIDNYELGYKASMFDRKFSIAAAVYQINWTGVQAEIGMGCGFSFIANAAKARSRGLEVETTTTLNPDLTLSLNAGYTAAEMLEDVDSIGAKAGDDMTQVPKYNVYAALDQGFEMFNRQAFVRLDIEAYGKYKTHFLATDEDRIASYQQVNLSGRIELKEGINASLHINNLFDKEIINWRSTTGNDYGNYHYIEYGNGINASLRLDFTF
ncbi:TonB-dependent receptor [Paraglaciecola sp.]|uniref:TonB-dependent receptor n=1 Tax=Paraglaciecola sp. TaxID=1920173 RepID=UPI0030F37C3A